MTGVWPAILCILTVGCADDHSQRVRLDQQVQRPDVSVVLITVDGLSVDKMDELLADGALPNIRRMIDGGVRVERAVSGWPTITYAQVTSLLTGQFPGHHGILGNKWFDRYSLICRDYATMRTYRHTDRDFTASTLYERLHDRMTVSIQCAVRRGATRIVDNWARSGIGWFFGMFDAVDAIMPIRFEKIAPLANRTAVWPVLIHAYFPALDEIGHRHGPDSAQYRETLIHVDRHIGRIREAVASAGMADRTWMVLVSDHGFQSVAPRNCFDVIRWLRRERGLKITEDAFDSHSFEDRYRHFLPFEAVVINGGFRRAAIHLRGPGSWFDRPSPEQVERLLAPQPQSGDRGIQWQDGVLLVARKVPSPPEEHAVELVSRHGVSRITRRMESGIRRYRYERATADALGGWADEELANFIASGWHDAAEWLAATADSCYPDLVVQAAEMFDSPRAGDLVLFAADGWDFAPGDRGGHGGVTRSDIRVPMIFAGPNLHGGSIRNARLVDVAPTILSLIRGRPADGSEPGFDGVDRMPEIAGSQDGGTRGNER